MKIDEFIIDKVLDNKASPQEAKEVANWFATEEGNEYLSKRFDKEIMRSEKEMFNTFPPHFIPEAKMKTHFMDEIKRKHKQRIIVHKWMRVAAVLLPFIFLSTSLLFLAHRTGVFSETEYAEINVPYGEQMQVILQDGSIVQLNSGSRIKYPKQFGLFNRTVELWGEGYFNVAEDKNRPFTVGLQEVEVKVTGTKFNIKAYPTESNIWVTLDEGGILFKDKNAKEYRLVPGERAEYNRLSGECLISTIDNIDQISAWRYNNLNFYLTPLSEIIKVMERHYDIYFIVKDSTVLKNRFTLSTEKVNASDVLHDLETVSNISFKEIEKGVFEVTAP